MERLCAYIILLFTTLTLSGKLFAQKDVTKFLGIPVDGYKSEMVKKLKSKGFNKSTIDDDLLVGEFNGKKAKLYVVTTNNNVSRIVVNFDKSMREGDAKIEFNNLYQQFEKNKKYISFTDARIPDDEKISYEMTVNNKRYEASFYQIPEYVDSITFSKEIQSLLSDKYTQEQLTNPNEEIKKEIVSTSMSYLFDKYSKKSVWFMISERFGDYHITIYYDNEYNRASGDDL